MRPIITQRLVLNLELERHLGEEKFISRISSENYENINTSFPQIVNISNTYRQVEPSLIPSLSSSFCFTKLLNVTFFTEWLGPRIPLDGVRSTLAVRSPMIALH